jgi:hypothetical protein
VWAPCRSQGNGSGQTLVVATLIHFRTSPPLPDDAAGKDHVVDNGGGISCHRMASILGDLLFSMAGAPSRQVVAEGYGSRGGGPGILAKGRHSGGLGIPRFDGYRGREGSSTADPRCSRL